MEDGTFFCRRCGKQLHTIDDILQGKCISCAKSTKYYLDEDSLFSCWSCGKTISSMDELAQGICNICKYHIIKKIGDIHTNNY